MKGYFDTALANKIEDEKITNQNMIDIIEQEAKAKVSNYIREANKVLISKEDELKKRYENLNMFNMNSIVNLKLDIEQIKKLIKVAKEIEIEYFGK
ncbi:MAG: hypothetical protein BWY36_00916 [Candidatus Diapherotrites archaeon ADurb.Bin253]|nr:MAG: hypothetical protein BWY36_00916 [Candidatus Diapherotrites archaeon ADurb.Bin253]